MQSAPIPANETERLAALVRYRIVDTDFETAYDELAELAAFICETPIALITLVTSDRQWFKAKVGLEARETSREIAFCAHAIHQSDIFVVGDASSDERFADNPLVTGDPHIRFYAGAPLITPDGLPLGTVCAIDREPRKLSELQTRALKIIANQVMIHLALRLTLDFQERTSAELARSNASKDRFFSILSHDLRSPFGGILGFTELLRTDLEQLSPDEIREFAGHIHTSAEQALKLIDNLLQWSMFETGGMRHQATLLRLDEVAGEVLALLASVASQKQIHLTMAPNPAAVARADRDMVQTVLRNLIGNALKFTPAGGRVAINFAIRGGWIEVSVTDSGVGLNEEQLSRIFQGDLNLSTRGTEGEKGMGLGLMLCRQFAEKCGGRIWAESHPGRGATFTFTLPATE